MKLLITLDNMFFVIVQLVMRMCRMSTFTAISLFFGLALCAFGFSLLELLENSPATRITSAMFWIIGGGMALAVMIKRTDKLFVDQFYEALKLRYPTPWNAVPKRLLRVAAMLSMFVVFTLESFSTPLMLAFFLNACSAYAIALALSEDKTLRTK